MKKAIVTGSTGFIGRFVVRELVKQGVEVYAMVWPDIQHADILPREVHPFVCNLSEIKKLPSLIEDRDIDAVFHIAWQGVSDSDARCQEVQIQNLVSTLDLIDAMREMGIKTIVGCGSLHEVEALVEMGQDKVVNNLGLYYKVAKTAAHWMGKAKAGSYGIRFFWPLINTYGEEERSARLVNTIIRKIFMGESPELSAGEQFYDFVHVSDVAHALYLIADKGIDGTNYTIGSGDAKPLKEFLKLVGKIANEINGSNIPLGFGKFTSNVISLPIETFNAEKLKRDTGFVPTVCFEEGIRRTAVWIRENQ